MRLEHGDRGAELGEALGDAEVDAAGAAGDEGDLAGQEVVAKRAVHEEFPPVCFGCGAVSASLGAQAMGAAMADALAAWHRLVRENDAAALEALLDENAVFISPVVHTPQVGRDKAALYLRGALQVLNNGAFRYVGEWPAPGSAVLGNSRDGSVISW